MVSLSLTERYLFILFCTMPGTNKEAKIGVPELKVYTVNESDIHTGTSDTYTETIAI